MSFEGIVPKGTDRRLLNASEEERRAEQACAPAPAVEEAVA